jgi:hypothetical protein
VLGSWISAWALAAVASGAPASAPAHAPIHAWCESDARERFPDWDKWEREMIPFSYGDLEFGHLKKLDEKGRATIEPMLRRGLEACDPIAAEAIQILARRALLPEVKALLDPANITSRFMHGGDLSRFRVELVLTANALDPRTDYAPLLVPLLADASQRVRMDAAMGARHFRLAGLRAPLLERVARDRDYLIRSHAADSLLVLGDVYPREVYEHREIFERIADSGAVSRKRFSLDDDPTPQDFERFAEAARMLDKLLADRAAAGACPLPVRPPSVHIEVHQVDPHLATVAVDPAESSCKRVFVFAVLVRSEAGFNKWVEGASMFKADSAKTELRTTGSKIAVEYARAPGTLRVGGVELGKDANVAFLTVDANQRLTATWRGQLDTTIKRDGDLVRHLRDQSPALDAALGR